MCCLATLHTFSGYALPSCNGGYQLRNGRYSLVRQSLFMCCIIYYDNINKDTITLSGRRDVAQAVEHSAVKFWIMLHAGSILHGGCICSLSYFSFQPVVHNWSIKGYGMCCPVGKWKKNIPCCLSERVCGDSIFPLKKYVTMTKCFTSNSWWYENQYALEASLNQTNFCSITLSYSSLILYWEPHLLHTYTGVRW